MWKVLVVDDNFIDRKLISEILKGKAECDIAASAKEAIEAYNLSIEQNRHYEVILLDIGMPDVDGIELLKVIREHEEQAGIPFGKGIPIIMVTGHKEQFMSAFKKGCDDYVLKPIHAKILMEKIESVMKKR